MRSPVLVFCLLSLPCETSTGLWVTLVMQDFITLCGSVIQPALVTRRGKFVATVEHVQR